MQVDAETGSTVLSSLLSGDEEDGGRECSHPYGLVHVSVSPGRAAVLVVSLVKGRETLPGTLVHMFTVTIE